jgi:hypothetical protein
VHDAEKEAQKVADAMASGAGPVTFGRKLDDAQKAVDPATLNQRLIIGY